MANDTYKEFGKYLRAVADEFSKHGDKPLLRGEEEYNDLFTTLCQMHNDYDHGAQRVEALKMVFISQCEDYGQGWTPIKQIGEDEDSLKAGDIVTTMYLDIYGNLQKQIAIVANGTTDYYQAITRLYNAGTDKAYLWINNYRDIDKDVEAYRYDLDKDTGDIIHSYENLYTRRATPMEKADLFLALNDARKGYDHTRNLVLSVFWYPEPNEPFYIVNEVTSIYDNGESETGYVIEKKVMPDDDTILEVKRYLDNGLYFQTYEKAEKYKTQKENE